MSGVRTVLALLLVAAAATPRLQAQDPADDAWNRGDHETARALYADRVAADSSDVRALHRLALLFAWNRDFEPSLNLFDRLVAVAPGNLDARIDRARVLSWANRFDDSIDAYTEALQQQPKDRRARIGLAQVLAWSAQLDSAAAVYEGVLADDPSDLEALQGHARVTAWSGDLTSAEARWRQALEVGGEDGSTLIGLSQTLRWQGRPSEAREALDRVPIERRSEPDYVEEARWVGVALAPTVAPSVTYEWDSDGNEMMTIALRAGYPVLPRLRVELSTYLRTTWDNPPPGDPLYEETLTSWGFTLGGRYVIGTGWTVAAGAGLSSSNLSDSWSEPLIHASVSSPGRYRYGGTLSFNRMAFDPTRDLVATGVTLTETALGLRARISDRWAVDGGAAYGIFDGTEANGRFLGHATGSYSIVPSWAAVGRVRSFGFEKSRGAPFNDAYFNPAFYFLGEVFPRWQPLRGPWHLTAEVGLGVEHIDMGIVDQPSSTRWGTFRLAVRASYDLAPGRQIGLSGMYTDNAGPFAGETAGYQYFATTLSGSWAF